jgi:hypothetical protein
MHLEVDMGRIIHEIIEIQHELKISDQSIVKALVKRGVRSGLFEDAPDDVVISVVKAMRLRLLMHYNTNQIESSLAAGPCPRPDSVTNGRVSEVGKEVV